MNKKKPNTKKIRLSLGNPNINNIKGDEKLHTKKSFDDTVLNREKDEFWGDCLESNMKYINSNKVIITVICKAEQETILSLKRNLIVFMLRIIASFI